MTTLFDHLIQYWEHFYVTMMNFDTAYPVLAPIASLTFTIPITYMIILNTKNQKSMREIFNIRARLKNPMRYTNAIATGLAGILILPLLLLTGLILGVIKIYFYLKIKLIEFKYREYK